MLADALAVEAGIAQQDAELRFADAMVDVVETDMADAAIVLGRCDRPQYFVPHAAVPLHPLGEIGAGIAARMAAELAHY